MRRQELRVFLAEWFCICGRPEAAAARLHDLLALHPLYDHREEIERLVPDPGFQHLLLYMLDRMGLTEHGGVVGGGWLSDKGKAVLAALNHEAPDGFEALTEQACVHGYAVETELPQCPECSKLNRRTERLPVAELVVEEVRVPLVRDDVINLVRRCDASLVMAAAHHWGYPVGPIPTQGIVTKEALGPECPLVVIPSSSGAASIALPPGAVLSTTSDTDLVAAPRDRAVPGGCLHPYCTRADSPS